MNILILLSILNYQLLFAKAVDYEDTYTPNQQFTELLENELRLHLTPEFVDNFLDDFNTKRSGSISSTINNYIDVVFGKIRSFMVYNGFDPMEMPNVSESFNYNLLLVNFHGQLKLNEGWIQDISSIRRENDVMVRYESDKRNFAVSLTLTFDDLLFSYKYRAKLMNVGPTGIVDGRAGNVRVHLTIAVDLKNATVQLEKFQINRDAIDINLTFTGNGMLDWILNVLIKIIKRLMRNTLVAIIEDLTSSTINVMFKLINEILDGVLFFSSTPLPAGEKLIW